MWIPTPFSTPGRDENFSGPRGFLTVWWLRISDPKVRLTWNLGPSHHHSTQLVDSCYKIATCWRVLMTASCLPLKFASGHFHLPFRHLGEMHLDEYGRRSILVTNKKIRPMNGSTHTRQPKCFPARILMFDGLRYLIKQHN